MAGRRFSLATPRRLLLSFVLVLLLPASAVLWLGVRLIQQDRELESRQVAERRQAAADRAVTLLEQAVSASERQLLTAGGPPIAPHDDAVVVVFGSGGMEARPAQHLLYYPDDASAAAEPSLPFESGEQLEFVKQDYAAAARVFEDLARSPIAAVRAGALLRLARSQRKLQRPQEALQTYARLAALREVQVTGLPADLVARHARCAVLDDLKLTVEREKEARALRADLVGAHWRIGRGVLLAYLAETAAWLGEPDTVPPDRLTLAAAVEWLSARRVAAAGFQTPRRTTLRLDGVPITILWQSAVDRAVALVAGPAFQRREWFSVLDDRPDVALFTHELRDADGPVLGGPAAAGPAARRLALESGLPWTVVVSDSGPSAMNQEFRDRRRLIVAGLAVLGLVVVVGGAFTVRAVSRELAAAQLQSDFVSAVSHEFRTPLTSLRQFTDLLNDREEPPQGKRRTFYQAQARATTRLQRLVESLLDFGRMQAGVRPYRLAPLALGDLVRQVADDFRRDAMPEGFTIELSAPDTPLLVAGDADALTRAVWNLLDNAIKYSGESRVVGIEVSSRGGAAAISVHDQGIGIPRAEHRKVFDKFVRGRAARAHQIPGTGIGLAMVDHIVKAHGGEVAVESEPGKGTTFTLTIPTLPTSERT